MPAANIHQDPCHLHWQSFTFQFCIVGEIALYTAQAKREKIIEYGEGYFVRLTMQFALLGARCIFWQ